MLGIKKKMRQAIILTMFAVLMGCSSLHHSKGNPRILFDAKEIGTNRVIQILKNEDIVFVRTTHSQHIRIELRDGRQYQGIYDYTEAGEYSNTHDVLNLVVRIQKERPELRDLRILCE